MPKNVNGMTSRSVQGNVFKRLVTLEDGSSEVRVIFKPVGGADLVLSTTKHKNKTQALHAYSAVYLGGDRNGDVPTSD